MILQFALRLLFGLSSTWCFMPREAVTVGFFRIQMLVALGLSVLGAMTASGIDPLPDTLCPVVVKGICIGMAVIAFVGSTLWMLGHRTAGAACGAIIAVGSATALLGLLPLSSMIPVRSGFVAVSELSSGWLVGGAVCAMLLGHWHLTATSMSLVPLTRLTHMLLAAASVRGVLALAALLTVQGVSWSGVPAIWLALRWAAGIIGPLVLGGMVLRILKYRNTQSATGVLFAAVILAFIGETTAALLYREFHWPL